MTNKILIVVIVILSNILMFMSSSNTTFFNTEAVKKINVLDSSNSDITNMELEEYIVGVVAAEMPASFDIEALKAQAIASRTYALYKMNTSKGNYDVVTDVSNQGYIDISKMKSKWGDSFSSYYEKIKKAVQETKNMVLTYNGEIIESYYFAMSNGYTEDASLVFSEDRDYLESVSSSYDNENLKNFKVEKKILKKEVLNKLNIKSNELIIGKIERSNTNRVNNIVINGITFKGTEVRKKLDLRSTDFSIREDGDYVIITTKGYGHGVGMSQYGANGMAQDGYNYEEILNHYYKNVKITEV